MGQVVPWSEVGQFFPIFVPPCSVLSHANVVPNVGQEETVPHCSVLYHCGSHDGNKIEGNVKLISTGGFHITLGSFVPLFKFHSGFFAFVDLPLQGKVGDIFFSFTSFFLDIASSGNGSFFCNIFAQKPVKRYKTLLAEIFPKSPVDNTYAPSIGNFVHQVCKLARDKGAEHQTRCLRASSLQCLSAMRIVELAKESSTVRKQVLDPMFIYFQSRQQWVVESGGKNIKVTVMTKDDGMKQLEEVDIDAIVTEIEVEKAAAEAVKKGPPKET
ncbi:hypothetical protein Dsin_005626 [Dipteronia sinensis]|uniref:Uncharacterized protein n=1 Tax=Dipteronia sinensis TaxID=43782 RepID=A0AAE0AY45_9ROSI|nr:hypothetical protein Dsin_005626 [Dipteronia sinensis]